MKIELNIPPGDKQRSFLDHFNSGLRQRMKGFSAESGFLEDGTYRSSVTGQFETGEEQVPLSLTLAKTEIGQLSWIEASPSGAVPNSSNWEQEIREFITSTLAAALSDSKKEFFFEWHPCYIGPQLDGEYWLPGFRLAPAIPDDSQPALMNAERIVSIAFRVQAVDREKSHAIGLERARRYSARLSMVLDVGLYEPLPELRWVIVPGTGAEPAQGDRYQLGIAREVIHLKSMPKKGEICPLGKYLGSLDERYVMAGNRLSLPPDARRILRGFDTLKPKISDALNRAARLYQVGLVVGRRYPSVALAYRVAALDAIVQANRPQFTSFRDFIKRNVPEEPGLKEAIDYLYDKARSAHFHSGKFPGGEFDLWSFLDSFMDDEWVRRVRSQGLGYELTRLALVNWIRSVTSELTKGDAVSSDPA